MSIYKYIFTIFAVAAGNRTNNTAPRTTTKIVYAGSLVEAKRKLKEELNIEFDKARMTVKRERS